MFGKIAVVVGARGFAHALHIKPAKSTELLPPIDANETDMVEIPLTGSPHIKQSPILVVGGSETNESSQGVLGEDARRCSCARQCLGCSCFSNKGKFRPDVDERSRLTRTKANSDPSTSAVAGTNRWPWRSRDRFLNVLYDSSDEEDHQREFSQALRRSQKGCVDCVLWPCGGGDLEAGSRTPSPPPYRPTNAPGGSPEADETKPLSPKAQSSVSRWQFFPRYRGDSSTEACQRNCDRARNLALFALFVFVLWKMWLLLGQYHHAPRILPP